MSRKSRQKKGRTLLKKALPQWLALPMLIFSLIMGTVGFLSPTLSAPSPAENLVPISAALEQAEASYSGPHLHSIALFFTAHGRLSISPKIANRTLLKTLKSYPAGTVFDMLVDGTSILSLSTGETEILSYETACRAIRTNNHIGILLGLLMMIIAVYSAWSLTIHLQYRRLT